MTANSFWSIDFVFLESNFMSRVVVASHYNDIPIFIGLSILASSFRLFFR